MENPKPVSPQRRRWSSSLRLVLAFAVIALAIALLIARGAKKSMVYYITVSELTTQTQQADREGLRVTGTVVPGSIESEPLHLRFQMTDGNQSVPVEYHGVIPDTFSEEGEVVVEGSYTSGGVFEADFLMAKCPSKYEMSPDEEMPENMPRPRSMSTS